MSHYITSADFFVVEGARETSVDLDVAKDWLEIRNDSFDNLIGDALGAADALINKNIRGYLMPTRIRATYRNAVGRYRFPHRFVDSIKEFYYYDADNVKQIIDKDEYFLEDDDVYPYLNHMDNRIPNTSRFRELPIGIEYISCVPAPLMDKNVQYAVLVKTHSIFDYRRRGESTSHAMTMIPMNDIDHLVGHLKTRF